jgi:hypothetical protein
MQSEFQFNNQMSLYIPHVFPNFTEKYIIAVFSTMGIGNVDHVDLVAKLDKNGNPYNAAYIHFRKWYDGPVATNFQERVKDPNRDAKLMYDDPWFWIVLENTAKKAKKHMPGARKECIDLTPGVHEISLNPEEQKEIDDLIENLYNEPIDISYEVDEYIEDELARIKAENQLLRMTIGMHIIHADECHAKITNLEMEVADLTLEIMQKDDTIVSDAILLERITTLVNSQNLEEITNFVRKLI